MGIACQIDLKLPRIHVEGTIRMKDDSCKGHHLASGLFEVGVGWVLNVQVATVEIIGGPIVYLECTVKCYRIVWLVKMELSGSTTAVDT